MYSVPGCDRSDNVTYTSFNVPVSDDIAVQRGRYRETGIVGNGSIRTCYDVVFHVGEPIPAIQDDGSPFKRAYRPIHRPISCDVIVGREIHVYTGKNVIYDVQRPQNVEHRPITCPMHRRMGNGLCGCNEILGHPPSILHGG